MTALSGLSELLRSLFSLWALLLYLAAAFGVVFAVSRKNYGSAVLYLIPFVCTYGLWQVLFDLHLFGMTEQADAFSRKLGGYAWVWWLAVFAALTAAAVLLWLRVIRYSKRSVTPAAVKLCLDQMPCGVCCWHDNGRVLFSNICMNRLCVALTDGMLLNGNLFRDKVSDGIRTVGDSVWRFSCRDISFAGETLHEMIASNITAEYAKTQALEKDKAETSRLKQKLQEYSLRMEETVRRQEILQAKVSIHDEMNKLMLSTMAAGKEDTAALDGIFSLWEQNALLLCMQADGTPGIKAAARVDDLANALGVRVHWRSGLPSAMTETQRDLFFSAAQEAVVNAAKHAGAENLEISFTEDETSVQCAFCNDGKVDAGEVHFVGGLANLVLLADEQGASVSAQAGETFTLFLRFTKNQSIG